MVFCETLEAPCLNANDNPHEDGSTVCKQLYRTQKLLAIDEKGKPYKTIIMLPTYQYNSSFIIKTTPTSLGILNF